MERIADLRERDGRDAVDENYFRSQSAIRAPDTSETAPSGTQPISGEFLAETEATEMHSRVHRGQ